MPLLETPEFLTQLSGEFAYLGPFVVLVLCGLGLPLPEEVTLIWSGIQAHEGNVQFWPIVAVCSVAILLGDLAPFWVGRRYGLSALKVRWVARILHPERFKRMEQRFQEHGNWATFVCRFFAGVRIPGYFVAGLMGMTFPRFILLDALGVAVSVPLSVYIGMLFGDQIDRLNQTISNFHMLLGFLVAALVVVMIVRGRLRKPRPQGETPVRAVAPAPGPPAGDCDPASSSAASAPEALGSRSGCEEQSG